MEKLKGNGYLYKFKIIESDARALLENAGGVGSKAAFAIYAGGGRPTEVVIMPLQNGDHKKINALVEKINRKKIVARIIPVNAAR